MTVVQNSIHAGLQERITGPTDEVRLSSRVGGARGAVQGNLPEIHVESIQPWRRTAQRFTAPRTPVAAAQNDCPPEIYLG